MSDADYEPSERAQHEEEQAAKAKARRVLAEAQWAEDIDWLMGDQRGRRFVSDLLRRLTPATTFAPQALQMAANAARVDFAAEVRREIAAVCPDSLFRMEREQHDADRSTSND